MAVNTIKKWLLFLVVVFTPMQSLADLEQERFKYEYTEFIIHFTPEGQVYNGRPNSPYDSQHYFSLFYDLLIKYVHRMESFDPAFSIQDIGAWHEMHMVSQFGSRALYVGDHILSDGKSWVAMSKQDYELLSELISETMRRDKEPVVNDKNAHLKNWVEEVRSSSSGETYEQNFKKYLPAYDESTIHKKDFEATKIRSLTNSSSYSSVLSASFDDSDSLSSSSIMNNKVADGENPDELVFDHYYSSGDKLAKDSRNAAVKFEGENAQKNQMSFKLIFIVMVVIALFFYMKK
ncbi:hypothetical protein [Cellvibrio fontiphilus]|uniref:Uncharacterized protein n=1 Tax=Cellvibrio fontiphilus TaxID=1815559 RepID=A0ABV7FJP7_9GAMM